MINVNKLTKIREKPLMWWEKVRDTWLCIILENIRRGQERRLGIIHIRGWIIIKIKKLFKSQKDSEERLKRELVAGSNDEKMSISITMGIKV